MHPYGLQMTSDKPALTASTEWPERVYELQKTDPVDAGADGIDNLAPNQLAARTNYLRVKGISDWAAVWNYPDGAFCQEAGVVYRAVTANAGKPPASNPAIWTRCPMTAAEIADAINLSDKQPVDATLTALAGLNTSADRLIYATGADQFALTPLTAFIRTLLDDVDAASARATLGAAPLASPALTGIPTAPTASTGTRSTQLATTAFVGAESQIAAPTGSVYTFAGSTVPTGWLKCNGALLSRTTYASLFAVIGTTYGAGDGSTTFALPDLRGEFVRGADDGRGVDAGRVLGSAQAGQNASHTHAASASPAGGHSHVFESLDRRADIDRGSNASLWSIDSTVTQTTSAVGDHIHAVTVNADGGNESRPRNVAMHYIIKY